MMKNKQRILYISLSLNVLFVCFFVSKRLYYLYSNSTNKSDRNFLASYNTVEIFKVLPDDSDEIIFIGDSYIQNFYLTEFFQNLKIKNRGVNGDSTSGVLARFNETTQRKPSKIFIELGVNDILNGVPIDTIYRNYCLIINQIKENSPGTRIYVQSILPNSFTIYNTNTPALFLIKEMNNRLIQLCKTKQIIYVDLYKHFIFKGTMNPKYTGRDKLHLNAEGYVLWKNIIEGYVAEKIN
jgi:lysophospholipase L1-like esterase